MQAFYEAHCPEPYQILGYRLRPLSIGHLILMHRFDVAFVKQHSASIDDLALGVFICSRDYEDALGQIVDGSVHVEMKRMAKHVVGPFWKRNKVGLLQDKIALFWSYYEEGSKNPEFVFSEGCQASDGVPLIQSVKVKLMKEMAFSESEILNRPWSLCLWDYITLGAMAGSVSIVEEGEMQSALKTANALFERLNGRSQSKN